MIKNYFEFSLYRFWNTYLNNEDIQKHDNLYNFSNLSTKKKTEAYESLEEEFYLYFTNLRWNDITHFLNNVKILILEKDYMSNYNKAHKIYSVICNWLFWFIYDNKNDYSDLLFIKKYYNELWEQIVKLSNDSYLKEKKEYYEKFINEL